VSERPPLWPLIRQQVRCEGLKLWRTPDFSLATILLPVIVFALIGLPSLGHSSIGGPALLASYTSYAVTAVMLYSFGSLLAIERGLRVDVLMRLTPVSPLVIVLARLLNALVFGLLAIVSLLGVGALIGGIHLEATVWLGLATRLLLGCAPFVALGFGLAHLAGPGAVTAVLNLVYIPLAVASGMLVPLDQLPAVVQQAAPYLPTYRFARLAWSAVGADPSSGGSDLLWLVGYTVLFVAFAVGAYRLDGRRFA